VPATVTAIVIAIWFARRGADSESTRGPAVVMTVDAGNMEAADTAIVAGRLVEAGREVTGEVPADATLHAPDGATIQLPAAVLVLAQATTIRWSRTDHTVFLDDGRLDAEVEVRAGTRLRVATARFIVEVTGTAFQVTAREVRVTRGTVRVIAPDSTILAAIVRAGESWTLPPEHPTTTQVTASTWLVRAQRSFKARDCKNAEHYADAALRATPTRKQAAAASGLLAECAQASGRLDEAARRYGAIATRFADLSAGETALIAAARLEAKRGHAGQARSLYERYLARYPSGQFVADARRALRTPE
jgi:hypothetical protein